MKKTIITSAVAAVLASPLVMAETTDQKVAKLEQQVASLSSLVADATSETVRVNGFASGAFGISDNDAGYAGYTTDGSYHQDSLFGLQGTFQPLDNFEATLQVVAKGEFDWEPEITWAYLGYTFDNDVKLRIGKLGLPLFMLSEYINVGYAMPWATSPEEVYGRVPITSFTGIDASYEIELDDSYINLQGFTGNENMSGASAAGGSGKVDDIVGAVMSWNDDYWTIRGSYTVATVKDVNFPSIALQNGPATTLPNIDSEKGSYASFGIRYEDETWLVMAEATQTRVDGYFSDSDSGYVTVGYHINQVMPYVSLARLETVDNDERTADNKIHKVGFASLNYERVAYSLGARWDIQPGLAMKFDATYATNFNATGGGLDGNLERDFAAGTAEQIEDSSMVYTIKLDATF